MSSPPNPNPDPSPEEEEIARLAALAALNDTTISMSNSLFPAFPSTMQLQGCDLGGQRRRVLITGCVKNVSNEWVYSTSVVVRL